MHSALNLPEIVREIFSHLDREDDALDDSPAGSGHRHGNGGGSSGPAIHNANRHTPGPGHAGSRHLPAYSHSSNRAPSLLAAALCCKLWEKPALDCLWREMRGIMPLLRLAPGFMEAEDRSIIITGRLDERTCSRFHEHRRRIQNLEIDALKLDVDFIELHHSTILRLGQFRDGFLPCLRNFRIRADESASLSLEKTILLLPAVLKSPELRNFSVFINPQSDADAPIDWLGPMTTLLMDANPALRSMRLTGYLPIQHAHCLGEWQHLKTMSLNLATENWALETMQALCTLPELSELRVDFKDTLPFTDLDSTNMGPAPFPRLAKLILIARLGFATQFLGLLPPDQLSQVNLRRSRGDIEGRARSRSEESTEWKLLCEALAKFKTSLRSISLDWSPSISQRNNAANNNLSAQNNTSTNIGCITILEPLLCLSHLATFQIKSLPPWLALGDRDIDRIAANFPRLESLYLGYTTPPVVDARPSLEALGILARRCPRLDRLSILLGNNEESGRHAAETNSEDPEEAIEVTDVARRMHHAVRDSDSHNPSRHHHSRHLPYHEGRMVRTPDLGTHRGSPFPAVKPPTANPGNSTRIQDSLPLSHNLRHLDLRETKFVSPMIAARSIDKLFPNLQTLIVHDGEQSYWMKMTIFQICQSVRKDQQWRDEEVFKRKLTGEWVGGSEGVTSGCGNVENEKRAGAWGGPALAEGSTGTTWKSRQYDGGWVGLEQNAPCTLNDEA